MAVFTLLVVRIAIQGSLPAPLVPSLWVPLAPASFFGIGIIRLFQSGVETGIIDEDLMVLAEIMAAMGIGFGVWLFVSSRTIIAVIAERKKKTTSE